MASSVTRARAYVNHGRWIADCPFPYCGNAEALPPGTVMFACSNCHQVASVEWPADPEGITVALSKRPVPQTRNWFPPDHELALRSGCPHGQSVQDLEDETHTYQGSS